MNKEKLFTEGVKLAEAVEKMPPETRDYIEKFVTQTIIGIVGQIVFSRDVRNLKASGFEATPKNARRALRAAGWAAYMLSRNAKTGWDLSGELRAAENKHKAAEKERAKTKKPTHGSGDSGLGRSGNLFSDLRGEERP